jgi:hypothetical protein
MVGQLLITPTLQTAIAPVAIGSRKNEVPIGLVADATVGPPR